MIAPHHQPRHLGSFTQTSRTSGSQIHLLILGRALNIDSRKGAPRRVLTTLIHALYHAPSPSSRTFTTRLGAQGSHMGAHTHKPHTSTSRCLALPGPLLPLSLHTGLMPPIVSPRHARQPLFAPGVGYRPCHALLSVLLCFLVFLLSPYVTHSLLRFLVMLFTPVYLLSWRYASARARRRAP